MYVILSTSYFPANIIYLFVCTWSGGLCGELVQYVARHLEIVPGDAERPDDGVLGETERRQSRDVLDVDVLVRRRFRGLDHRAAATSTAATASRIIPRHHQRPQTGGPARRQVLHHLMTRTADDERVLVMVILTNAGRFLALTGFRRSWRR